MVIASPALLMQYSARLVVATSALTDVTFTIRPLKSVSAALSSIMCPGQGLGHLVLGPTSDEPEQLDILNELVIPRVNAG